MFVETGNFWHSAWNSLAITNLSPYHMLFSLWPCGEPLGLKILLRDEVAERISISDARELLCALRAVETDKVLDMPTPTVNP